MKHYQLSNKNHMLITGEHLVAQQLAGMNTVQACIHLKAKIAYIAILVDSYGTETHPYLVIEGVGIDYLVRLSKAAVDNNLCWDELQLRLVMDRNAKLVMYAGIVSSITIPLLRNQIS